MKIIICDRCHCTDKEIQKGEIKWMQDEKPFIPYDNRSFHQVEGFDFCHTCYNAWLHFHQNSIEAFLENVTYIERERKKGVISK